MNSKISYSKHTLLSTPTNLQLTYFSTILPRLYIRPTLLNSCFFYYSFFLFFLSSLYLFLFYCHYHSFIFFLLSSLLSKILIIGIIFSALLLDGLWVLHTYELLPKFSSSAWWIWANWLTFVLSGIIKKFWFSDDFLEEYWLIEMLCFAWFRKRILVTIPYMIIDNFRSFYT